MLHIDFVILCMAADKADKNRAGLIIDFYDQPILVDFDIDPDRCLPEYKRGVVMTSSFSV